MDRADLGLLTWPEQLDAVRYELEVLDGIPLDLDSAREAAGALYRNSRIYSAQALLPMEKLRKKQTTGVLYYRVRAFDLDGRPLGNYSQAVAVQSSLQKVERNASVPRSRMQDTNGSLLLYPVYAYTGNPGATQSESGDTSAMMVERFDRDVRPFHLKYLLIMGGTNSLRAGVSAEEVIRDLEEIGQKAEALGIHPIYLTLHPSIRPTSRRPLTNPRRTTGVSLLPRSMPISAAGTTSMWRLPLEPGRTCPRNFPWTGSTETGT